MKKVITFTTLVILSCFLIASNHSKIMQTFAQKDTTTYAEDVYLARLNMSYVKDKDTLKRILIKDYRQGYRYSQDVVFYDEAEDLDLISLSGGWPVSVDDLKEKDNSQHDLEIARKLYQRK
jgi:lipoprotein